MICEHFGMHRASVILFLVVLVPLFEIWITAGAIRIICPYLRDGVNREGHHANENKNPFVHLIVRLL